MKELTIRALEANIAYKAKHNLPKKTIILEACSLELPKYDGDITKLVEQVIQLTSEES